MNKGQVVLRVRSMTRDLSNSIFRQIDVTEYINEGIDRIRQVIPELNGLVYLDANSDVPVLLPDQYHHLLAVYSSSRCFFQDERHYQATNLMNEFEIKLEDLHSKIQAGEIIIKDALGVPIVATYQEDYVEDNYFTKRSTAVDLDAGVGGV